MCLSHLITLTCRPVDLTCVHTTTHILTFANTVMFLNTHLNTHRLIYAQGMYGSYKNKLGLFL